VNRPVGDMGRPHLKTPRAPLCYREYGLHHRRVAAVPRPPSLRDLLTKIQDSGTEATLETSDMSCSTIRIVSPISFNRL